VLGGLGGIVQVGGKRVECMGHLYPFLGGERSLDIRPMVSDVR